jgi:hypothetical protein
MFCFAFEYKLFTMSPSFECKDFKSIKRVAILQKGRISVAHIADDIQKQSKTFYLLYI